LILSKVHRFSRVRIDFFSQIGLLRPLFETLLSIKRQPIRIFSYIPEVKPPSEPNLPLFNSYQDLVKSK